MCAVSKEQLVDIVQGARGTYGPCSEYILETAQALELAGIRDRKLQTLVAQLRDKPPSTVQGSQP